MIADPIYWIIILVFMVAGAIVSAILRKRFEEYSKIPTPYNLTGAEIAQLMLKSYQLHDVKIQPTEGFLSDHYNPLSKTISLSEATYNNASIAAAAVAAHETGHAIQHATSYPFLMLRSALVPIVNISSSLMNYIILASLFFGFTQKSLSIALAIIVISYGIFALFSLVTLPVEIDASRRAIKWLEQSGITQGKTHEMAKTALKWAAYTYVLAFLSSLTQFLYWLAIFLGSQGRRKD